MVRIKDNLRVTLGDGVVEELQDHLRYLHELDSDNRETVKEIAKMLDLEEVTVVQKAAVVVRFEVELEAPISADDDFIIDSFIPLAKLESGKGNMWVNNSQIQNIEWDV